MQHSNVGLKRWGDGVEGPPRLERTGAMVKDRMLGPMYTLAMRGELFHYSTAAGGIALAAVTTANQFTIWNPAGNDRIFIPLRVEMGLISGAAAIAGAVSIYIHRNAGAAIGTGAPFTVFTDIYATVFNGLMTGRGYSSRMRFSTTNTATAAPVLLCQGIFNQYQSRPANAWSPVKQHFELDGSLAFMPGTAFVLAANTAMALTVAITVIGAEVPMPLVSRG